MSLQLIAALQDCVSVMERELSGLAVIQPELKQARAAIAEAAREAFLVPPPWTGEGQPPVGTVCEVFEGDGYVNWEADRKFLIGQRVTVRASFVNDCDQNICAIELDSNQCFCILAKLLRPIRTPEQIAAEERETRIADLTNAIEAAGWTSPEILAAYLESHGYRKQVAP